MLNINIIIIIYNQITYHGLIRVHNQIFDDHKYELAEKHMLTKAKYYKQSHSEAWPGQLVIYKWKYELHPQWYDVISQLKILIGYISPC